MRNPLLGVSQVLYALTIKMDFIAVVSRQAFDLFEGAALRPVPTVEERRDYSDARVTGHGRRRHSFGGTSVAWPDAAG